MDLAMARVSGYLSSKETVLASQQETLSRLMDELTRVETRQRQALALELHDNLAQRLASTVFSAAVTSSSAMSRRRRASSNTCGRWQAKRCATPAR
jgi:signal transduction histidine kinase